MKKAKLFAIAFALFNGMVAVVASALASHALGHQSQAYQVAFDMAARMHLIHSLLMLVIARWWLAQPYASLGLSSLFLGLGILCFSFSIYSKLLIADSFLSRLTPLGGLFFMVGWLSPLLCLIDLWRQARSSASPS